MRPLYRRTCEFDKFACGSAQSLGYLFFLFSPRAVFPLPFFESPKVVLHAASRERSDEYAYERKIACSILNFNPSLKRFVEGRMLSAALYARSWRSENSSKFDYPLCGARRHRAGSRDGQEEKSSRTKSRDTGPAARPHRFQTRSKSTRGRRRPALHLSRTKPTLRCRACPERSRRRLPVLPGKCETHRGFHLRSSSPNSLQ